MQKLLILAGLVAIEKMQFAVELAHALTDSGHSVTILDNIARLRIDPEWLSTETLIRHEGDILPSLPNVIENINTDTVIFAVSENTNPDDLFVALDLLRETQDNLEIHTLALLDLRTCDCFPTLRANLEQYADIVLHAPFAIQDVLERLG